MNTRMVTLSDIKNYKDLQSLDDKNLKELCASIREEITKVVNINGGHLSSSLGAVELIISLLKVFDPQKDKIIFDVGHQSYAYKLLTDRKDRFGTLRKWGGISGFPNPSESKLDHYIGGHSSISISAALGYAKARDLLKQDHHVVAVLGDGALINGVAMEALNSIKETKSRIILILNDNKMSINERVGGFADHLAKLSVHPVYTKIKETIKDQCKHLPKGEIIEKKLSGIKYSLKHFLQPANMFEELGISYWGPFDGHNLQEMETIFNLATRYHKPLLIHIVTQKGKGVPYAEEKPAIYHGVSPTQKSKIVKCNSVEWSSKSWSEAFSETILKFAQEDSKIVCLTAAMKEGSKLHKFQESFPDRFFDVGIAEEHMLSFAAGLSAGGLKPVVSIYSTFLQRAMDQLVIDIAMQQLPVVIAVDRAGLVGEDGPTHHGLFDVCWARSIPGLNIIAPRDIEELEIMLRSALNKREPSLIRFPKGLAPLRIGHDTLRNDEMWRKSVLLEKGTTWAIITYGTGLITAYEAYELAIKMGIPTPSILDIRFIKPLDRRRIEEILSSHKIVITLEEGYKAGGIGEAICEIASNLQNPAKLKLIAIEDRFIPHGSKTEQLKGCNLTAEEVVNLYLAN